MNNWLDGSIISRSAFSESCEKKPRILTNYSNDSYKKLNQNEEIGNSKTNVDQFTISKQEIEAQLRILIALTTQDKAQIECQTNNLLEIIKNNFLNIIHENSKLKYMLQNTPETTEIKLKEKLFDLENDRYLYDERIKSHAMYILDLEQKVNILVEDYERVVKENEILNEKLQAYSRQGTPKHIKNRNSDRESALDTTNFTNCVKDADELSLLREENLKFKRQIDNFNALIASNQATISTINSSMERLLKENETLKAEIKNFDNIKQSLKEASEHYKIKAQSLEKSNEQLLLQIEVLNQTLKRLNDTLEQSRTKMLCLEAELRAKSNVENLINANLALVSSFELKINELSQQNISLNQKLNEDTKGMKLSDCKSDYRYFPEEINHLRKTFELTIEARDKEILNERLNQKILLDKYNSSIQILEGKVKALVGVNEMIIKDLESTKSQLKQFKSQLSICISEIKPKLDDCKQFNFIEDDGLKIVQMPAYTIFDLRKILDGHQMLKASLDKLEILLKDRQWFLYA